MPDAALPDHNAPGRGTWLKTAAITVAMWIRKEPAATQAIILAFLALGIAFQWWTWSNGQIGAVFGIAAALLGMFVRSLVTPLAKPTAMGQRLVPNTGEPTPARQEAGRRG